MSTTTLPLSTPIEGGGEPITSITLRPPSLLEYASIGEPYDFPQGVYVENTEAIAQYVELAIDPTVRARVMAGASLRDAVAIKNQVLDFFIEARRVDTPQTSPTSSSSTPG